MNVVPFVHTSFLIVIELSVNKLKRNVKWHVAESQNTQMSDTSKGLVKVMKMMFLKLRTWFFTWFRKDFHI